IKLIFYIIFRSPSSIDIEVSTNKLSPKGGQILHGDSKVLKVMPSTLLYEDSYTNEINTLKFP
ncbi:hypothetical protein, partial [Enterococcus faecalis]|uniref:hypothetical protein n=1 Tax=Enterococcus faecalis TaxID=1351 RepID=UPI001C65D3BA